MQLLLMDRRPLLATVKAMLESMLQSNITTLQSVDPAFAAQLRDRRLPSEDQERLLSYKTSAQKIARMDELKDLIDSGMHRMDQLNEDEEAFFGRAQQSEAQWQAQATRVSEALTITKQHGMLIFEKLLLMTAVLEGK